MSSDVEAAYSTRAAEYVEKIGSTRHPSDLALITSWAESVDGPILDAGCGPGHWTGHLAEQGKDARGIDQVPEFIHHARKTYPGVSFELGTLEHLPYSSSSVAAILAWYSLIHHEPTAITVALDEFARVLRPSGALLLGFFIGPVMEPFDHTVVTAYRWPPEVLAKELCAAGFDIIETHTRTGRHPKPRPHGAILAERVQLT